MSTRAIVACSAPDGTWRGVFNHWSGHTQHLGRWIIREIGKRKGDLDGFGRDVIDACPEGWSDLAKGERSDDPFGMISFDAAGAPTPKALPEVEA